MTSFCEVIHGGRGMVAERDMPPPPAPIFCLRFRALWMAPPQNLRDLPIILNLPQGMAVRVSGRVGRSRAPPPAIRSLKVAGGERALLSPLFSFSDPGPARCSPCLFSQAKCQELVMNGRMAVGNLTFCAGFRGVLLT